ncbi:MAG: CocE/NonD family hydrolase [Hyphomonadaceae bacterium]
MTQATLLPIRVEHDLMVEMRDGVRLATDVFHPIPTEAGGVLPVLLYRTPYSKDLMAANFGFASWFAQRGYVVVQQDCRGCFKSEGDLDFLLSEAEDGFDTLAWIEQQTWGDADVGSFGTSWSAWSQTAMAALQPRRLKTVVPMMSGFDGYASSVRHGGALELRWIAWAFWHSVENTQARLGKTPEIEAALIRPEKRFSDWLKTWPIRKGETQLALTPAYESWAFDLINEADRSTYWDHPSLHPGAYTDAISRTSALYIGSWYDSYTRATFENYLSHSTKGRARLIVGPWLHGTATVEQSHAGDISFPDDAALNTYKDLLLRWFDLELKGKPDNGAFDASIRLYVIGGGQGSRDPNGRLAHGGRWRDAQTWPVEGVENRAYYLHDDARLCTTAPQKDSGERTFRFDPSNPVPSIGGSLSSMLDIIPDPPSPAELHRLPHLQRTTPITAPGGYDQRIDGKGPLSERRDILVFETSPLVGDTEVLGPIEVHLWVSTDAIDTDFTAKLIDVYPPSAELADGYALNLSDSIIRLRYRHGDGKPQFVRPGDIVPITITLYPVGNVFAAGHRIRLDISSSNFPRFDVNANTGRAEDGVRGGVIANNTVHCSARYPSHLVLPLNRG